MTSAIKRVPRAAAICSLTLLFAGCATVGPPPPSGFLGDYAELRVDPGDDSLLWWEHEGFDWSRYSGVILEPVTFYYHAQASDREIRPDELKQLADAFREIVIAELGDAYHVTEEPGADVLRVRCAITDVIPVRPALNAVTSIATFVAIDVGGAAIEVEFVDSLTGERVAAGVDRKVGKRINGITGLTRFGQADEAFHAWARDFRRALDTNP
jgi:hypothetical protein